MTFGTAGPSGFIAGFRRAHKKGAAQAAPFMLQ